MLENTVTHQRSVSVHYTGGQSVTVAMSVQRFGAGGRLRHVEQLHCQHVDVDEWNAWPEAALVRALRLLTAGFPPGAGTGRADSAGVGELPLPSARDTAPEGLSAAS